MEFIFKAQVKGPQEKEFHPFSARVRAEKPEHAKTRAETLIRNHFGVGTLIDGFEIAEEKPAAVKSE